MRKYLEVSMFLILKSFLGHSEMDVFIVTRQILVIVSVLYWCPSFVEAGIYILHRLAVHNNII